MGSEVLKVRVKNSDVKKGKSGGYRLIYWIQTPSHIVLVDIYTQSEQNHVEDNVIRQIIAEFDQQSGEELI